MGWKTGALKGLAGHYLALQGTWHERKAMGKGKVALLGREVMESNFKRNGNSSVNSAIQGITGRLDEVQEGDA